MTEREQPSMCLKMVQAVDSACHEILAKATDVKLYEYGVTGKWIPKPVEGMLLFYRRSNSPPFGLLLLSRDSIDSWNQKFGVEVEIQSRPPFLLYKRFDPVRGNCIEALWFPDSERCDAMFSKVRATTVQPSTLSYAAMVAGPKTSDNDSNGTDKRRGSEEEEMEQRSQAAEQAVKAFNVTGKSGPCQHCGKTSHASDKCWKGRDAFQPKQEPRGGPIPRGPSQRKANEVQQRTRTFENTQHAKSSAPVPPPTVPAASNFIDSAILESSSSSSGDPGVLPLTHNRQTLSPLNLNALLTGPPGSNTVLPHAASLPSFGEPLTGTTWAGQNLRLASDQLKGFLGVSATTTPAPDDSVGGLQNGKGQSARGKPASSCSVDETAPVEFESKRQFVRDVSDRLNGVQGVPPVTANKTGMPVNRSENGRIYPEMALRPPHHFESLQTTHPHQQSQFLLPEDMERDHHLYHPQPYRVTSSAATLDLDAPAAQLGLPLNPPAVNPLTKNQLIQSLDWLMRNDRDFVNKLHEGYIRSLMENLRL